MEEKNNFVNQIYSLCKNIDIYAEECNINYDRENRIRNYANFLRTFFIEDILREGQVEINLFHIGGIGIPNKDILVFTYNGKTVLMFEESGQIKILPLEEEESLIFYDCVQDYLSLRNTNIEIPDDLNNLFCSLVGDCAIVNYANSNGIRDIRYETIARCNLDFFLFNLENSVENLKLYFNKFK